MLEKIVKNIPVTPTTPNMAFLVLNEDKQTYTRYVSDEQGKVKKVQSSVNLENSDDIIAVKTDTGIKFSLNPNNQSVESVKTELNQAIENVKNTINSNLENKLEKGNYTGTAEDLRDLITDLTHIVISDDSTLNSLKAIVSYIKQNRETLDTLSVDNIAGLPDALNGKVDKSGNKQLSDENFTTTLKEKLEGIDLTSYVTNEVYNRVIGELTTKSTELSNKLQVDDHTLDDLQKVITLLKQVKQTVDSAVTTEENFTTVLKQKLENIDLDTKVDKVPNKQLSTEDFTSDLKNKLEGINLSDYATVASLNDKVNVVVGKDLSSNDFTNDLKSKLENIDLNTKVDKEQGKSLSTNDFTNELKGKVEEIDDILSKLGTTISDLDTLQKIGDSLNNLKRLLDSKVNVDGSKQLSQEDFTTALKNKLESLDLSTKVDVVLGKQLSQEDFTTVLKQKLEGLDLQPLSQEINAIKGNLASNDGDLDTIQKLVDKIKEIKGLVDNKVSTDGDKQLSTEDFTTALKNKLEGINLSDYATTLALNGVSVKLDSNDSQLDTLQKVVDLLKQIQTSVGNKVDVEQGKSLSANDFTTPLKQKLEGIDMNTKVDKVVGKQLSQEDFTTTLKQKLEGIDLSTKVNVEAGKGLSQENFTTALKTKLDNLRDPDLKAINITGTSFAATRDHVGKLLMYDNNSDGAINFNAFTDRDWCFVMNATNGTGICTIQNELDSKVLRKDEIGIVVKWGVNPELTYILSLDYLKPNTIRTVDNQERKFKEISRADFNRLSTKDPNIIYMVYD